MSATSDAAGPGPVPGSTDPSALTETPDGSVDPAIVDVPSPSGAPTSHTVRQPVVRVHGSRRARLMPAPGTTAEPAPADDPARGASAGPVASGPNDERMLRDVPPHY